tara:strand:+ start:611 stop:898 length:288 start_codon:yes stop_codon:yes gene_type:complete
MSFFINGIEINILNNADKMIHNSKFNLKNIIAKIPDDKHANISYFFLIIGIMIAIKLNGIIKDKLIFSGTNCPKNIPKNVEICHVKNNVKPDPSR